MSNVLLIFRKELRSYFDSPSAYVFMVLFLILSGIYVVGNIFLENVASLRLLFDVAPIVMLVFVPAVTMGLISEERRQRTFELLGTRPVLIGEIVTGKLFAAWVLVACTLLPTLLYAIILSMIGSLDWGAVLGGFCGLLLLGGAFVAIGLFASALSDNQVIALIVGSILVSCLFFVDKILPFMPASLIGPVEYLSAGHHLSSLARGILDSRDIVYYASVIGLFLLLATLAAAREYGQSFREWRQFQLPVHSVRIMLVGTIILLANLVSTVMFFRADLTAGELYTLSPTTKKVLLSLDDDVLVRVYLTADLPPPYHNYGRDIRDMLEEYHIYSNGRVQFRFINPVDSTGTAREAAEAGIQPMAVKVLKNDRIQTIKAFAGLAFSYADRFETLPMISSVDRLEYDLTSTIKRLRMPTLPTVGILAGHGSPGPESMRKFIDDMVKHYRISSVTLADSGASLADVTALLVIGPKVPFDDNEKAVLDQYIMRGGKVAFFVDAMTANSQHHTATRLDLQLDDMFDTYGWNINNDLVVDNRCVNVGLDIGSGSVVQGEPGPNPFFPLVTDFNKNMPAVAQLPSIVLPYTSSIDVRLASVRGVDASVVASSSPQSARLSGDDIDISTSRVMSQVAFNEERIPLAATFEGSFKSAVGTLKSKPGKNPVGRPASKSVRTRMVVIGDGDFLVDGITRDFNNTTFALNLVDWLVDETGAGTIRTREVAPPPLDEMSDEARMGVKYLAFVGPPALVIIGGLFRLAMKASRRRR